MPDEASLVTASEIPWREISGQELEEFLYWLCEDLGAKDVVWRTGAAGPSADGGRDIEALFHVADADGTLQPRRWWLQAKGRASTVEAMAVKEAVITAAGHAAVDTVVIATNAGFSNPTRDWVTEFGRGHERPEILLWDRHALEPMAVKHPSVVLRIAPQALAPQGQVEAITARFTHSVRLPARHELEALWSRKDEIRLDPFDRLPLVCAEVIHGDPSARPWLLDQDDQGVLTTCAIGMANLPPLVHRCLKLGVDERPVFRLGESLVEAALARLSANMVRGLLNDPWALLDEERSEDARQIVHEHIFDPVISHARRLLGTACAADCPRMSADPPDDQPAAPFRRLLGEPVDPARTRSLDLENLKAQCAVGLDLDDERTCPWFVDAPLVDVVEDVQQALAARLDEERQRLEADSAS
jgi:hypothetical protein